MEKSKLPNHINDVLFSVLGKAPAILHEPSFIGNEWKYVKDCLDTTFVSSAVGKYVDKLEEDLAEYTGAKHAIAVVNGTSALHISLLLAGVQPGDEVLIPTLTFIATANAIKYCGATPHFVDSEETTLGIDPRKLRKQLLLCSEVNNGVCINKQTKKPIRALVPMHTFGHPSNLDELKIIADEFSLKLIEDAAESLGSFYKGKHTGTIGLFGILSFNGNKTITTGGGGAILTNDSNLAKKAKHITTTAKVPHSWDFNHDEVGFNYRMPNINAAIGCAQLENLDIFLKSKRELNKQYCDAFDVVSNLKIFKEPPNSTSNYWLQALILDSSIEHKRDDLLMATNKAGYMCRPVWKLIHTLEPYKECPSQPTPVAESLEKRLINLPSSAGLV